MLLLYIFLLVIFVQPSFQWLGLSGLNQQKTRLRLTPIKPVVKLQNQHFDIQMQTLRGIALQSPVTKSSSLIKSNSVGKKSFTKHRIITASSLALLAAAGTAGSVVALRKNKDK
jgi:hypothetical protein